MVNNTLKAVDSFLSKCFLSENNTFSHLLGVTNSTTSPLTTETTVKPHSENKDGIKVFSNHFSALYEEEKTSARSVKPFEISSPQASDIIAREERFLWTLTEDNTLHVSQVQTTHAVCAGNKNVISAGEGQLQDGVLVLENRTGHYRVTFESLDFAVPHFKSCNVKFKRIEKKDILGELKLLQERAKEEFEKSQERRNEYFRSRSGGCLELSF